MSTSSPVHLLQLQAIRQRLHRYFPLQYFVSGVDDIISNLLSWSWDLTNTSLLAYTDLTYPQRLAWLLWTLPSALVSTISSTLWRTISPRASLLAITVPSMGTGKSGMSYAGMWSSNPYSYCKGIRSLSSTHYPNSIGPGKSPQANINYTPKGSRILYGLLSRNLLIEGPRNPASQAKRNWISACD